VQSYLIKTKAMTAKMPHEVWNGQLTSSYKVNITEKQPTHYIPQLCACFKKNKSPNKRSKTITSNAKKKRNGGEEYTRIDNMVQDFISSLCAYTPHTGTGKVQMQSWVNKCSFLWNQPRAKNSTGKFMQRYHYTSRHPAVFTFT